MARIDVVREVLAQRDDVVELQVQYVSGEVQDYSVTSAEELEQLISGIEWDQVKEVELEYANEEEHEIDFEELEDDEDDDVDDEDEDDDDDDEDEDEDDDDEDEDEDDDDDEDDMNI